MGFAEVHPVCTSALVTTTINMHVTSIEDLHAEVHPATLKFVLYQRLHCIATCIITDSSLQVLYLKELLVASDM